MVDVGTGYGKTLCMIIPCLLDSPSSISIVISPLKRLQAVQVLEFEGYGITTVTVAINEDTPNDSELNQKGLDDNLIIVPMYPERVPEGTHDFVNSLRYP